MLQMPIGHEEKLVKSGLSSCRHKSFGERIGVQWQKVAILDAMPSMTGTSVAKGSGAE